MKDGFANILKGSDKSKEEQHEETYHETYGTPGRGSDDDQHGSGKRICRIDRGGRRA